LEAADTRVAKQRTRFVCQSCGAQAARWAGKCDSCGGWNTFVEELIQTQPTGRGARTQFSQEQVQAITAVEASEDVRMRTGLAELDRVLGGGIVAGSVMLLGGDPGIGKSTLMMQLGKGDQNGGPRILYVSGEESLRQIKLRADRLGVGSKDFLVYAETNLDSISRVIDEARPELVIIDSIQTVYRPELESAPGSVSQVRECTALLLRQAKATGIPMFIIGHVTKDGAIAGPRVLEHMVDTVLQFEGDHHHAYRIVRGLKNRFGSTHEIGIFEMRENGLREVNNPSEVFLSERSRGISGSCVCASLEGTRSLLVEVQALVAPANYGVPQRTVTGLDGRRVSMLLAVLEKRYGLRVGQYDVFVNIAGGVRIDEPSIDLAVCAAVVSSARDIAIDHGTAVVGEVGLGGEVRSVNQLEKRVIEAEKLGFRRILLPTGNLTETKRRGITVVEVDVVAEAIEKLLSPP
jgi:DNA repair protein RadA/Sms